MKKVGFQRHFVGLVMLGALLSVPVLVVGIGTTVARTVFQEMGVAHNRLAELDQAGCLQDPAYWDEARPGVVSAGFDLGTGLSAAPVPPLVPEALELFRTHVEEGGMGEATLFLPRPLRGGRAFLGVPLAESGPCSLTVVSWDVDPVARTRIIGRILVVALPLTVLLMLLTMRFALQPLRNRLERLAGAASGVGAGYASAADAAPDVIGQVSSALDAADDRIRRDADLLRARGEALREHLAHVAHDLRTPMAALQLNLEGLLSEELPADVQTRIQRAMSDVVYLSGLTRNLRLASTLRDEAAARAAGLAVEDIPPMTDLGAIVERVSQRFQVLGRPRGIQLAHATPEDPLVVPAHPILFEQVLANLVHNAVKYGDENGHVAILLEEEEGRFTLSVIDDGPGVPPTVLPRLGERTFRSDSARSRGSGTGLGLAIVAEVCSRSGWKLELSANEPRGLCATIQGATLWPGIERDPSAAGQPPDEVDTVQTTAVTTQTITPVHEPLP